MSSTSLTTRFSEDDFDDSEGTGAYGDVFGKSIEKLKDASSVSSLYATFFMCWMGFCCGFKLSGRATVADAMLPSVLHCLMGVTTVD